MSSPHGAGMSRNDYEERQISEVEEKSVTYENS